MDSGSELFAQVEIIVPGDQRKLVEGFDSKIREAFQTATRYQKRFCSDVDLVNFGRTHEGHSWFVFAEQMAAELNGNGEGVFEWLYKMSKYAIGLAKLGKTKKVA